MKIVFLSILLLITSAETYARDVVRYDIPSNGGKDCKVVTYFWSTYDMKKEIGVRYEWDGSCTNGYAQGRGTHKTIRPDGGLQLTTASYMNGMEQGPGTTVITRSNGVKIVFSGTFKDGYYAQGTRTYTDPNKLIKEVYEGPFWNNEKSGKGSFYYKSPTNELKYTGDFLNNQMNGYGSIYFYATGLTWNGPFTNGKMNGTGRYSTTDGQYGSMQFADGEKITEDADPPVQLSPQQLREIFPAQQQIIPFNCTTYGGTTSCR